MIPIYHESAEGQPGYRFDEFQDRFLQICEDHRAEGRALAFAFLLYNLTHPEIRRVLATSDYWAALNEISGDLLSVFSIHVREPQREPRGDAALAHGMTPLRVMGDPGQKAYDVLRDQFGIGDRLNLPAILFFQTDQDGTVEHFLVSRHSSNVG